MIWQKISYREKILLLLVLSLFWIFGVRYFYLPIFYNWINERNLVELKKGQEEISESGLELLREEIKILDDRFSQLSQGEIIEFSVSTVHLFLTEIPRICGGVFLKIEMTCLEDQKIQNIDLSFIWQGDYDELINCFNFLKTLPWLLEEESVILTKMFTSQGNALQWEYKCKLSSKRKAVVQAKEPFIIEEESRDPFQTK